MGWERTEGAHGVAWPRALGGVWLGGELAPNGQLSWNAPLWQILTAVGVGLLCLFLAYLTRGTERKYFIGEIK